jgi:hypothetical protein
MIDRDTVIDLCAAIDTAFMKQEVGTYNEFDKYATFALHIEAIAIKEEREACAKYLEGYATRFNDIRSAALETAAEHLRARGEK